ncbi:MAG: hypothetical protein CL843_06525 [Crocinitomicaceae bacterium]|nr:hypothetical protein [Crocinitomicaceae bacterium]
MRSAASIILMACYMKTLLLKTHRPTNTYTQPHFFILNKGLNSGKPLKAPCPNCFVCLLENPDSVDQVYWIAYALWKSRQLEIFLRGSVIPFLTIGEYRKHFLRTIKAAEEKEQQLEKLIQTFKLLEIQEQKIHVSLKMIETARMAFFRELL